MGHLPEEVLYGDGNIVTVDHQRMESLKQQALKNKRSRIRLCTHKDRDDAVHEMLIFHAKGNYIPPHKHRDKPESFHVIEGSTTIILFDDVGSITNVIPMGEFSSKDIFYYRVGADRYHCHIVTSDIFVYHETTKGPFCPADTIFAPWAPDESDDEVAQKYMLSLGEQIEKFQNEIFQ